MKGAGQPSDSISSAVADAPLEAGQPSDSISSVVADGVSPPVREVACAGNKSQAETPEPKVSLGIPRKTHSPKRLPWGHPYLHSLFRGLPASVPAKHLCPPGEPVELPNFMDAAPAAAKAAAVSAAAPHPARAAAPHGSSAVAGVATTPVWKVAAARKNRGGVSQGRWRWPREDCPSGKHCCMGKC